MTSNTFKSVWDALENTPVEAKSMKLRSSLMRALKKQIRSREWTKREAAQRFGVTQSRISDLMRGRISRFSLDTLVNMVSAAGLHVDMKVAEAA